MRTPRRWQERKHAHRFSASLAELIKPMAYWSRVMKGRSGTVPVPKSQCARLLLLAGKRGRASTARSCCSCWGRHFCSPESCLWRAASATQIPLSASPARSVGDFTPMLNPLPSSCLSILGLKLSLHRESWPAPECTRPRVGEAQSKAKHAHGRWHCLPLAQLRR